MSVPAWLPPNVRRELQQEHAIGLWVDEFNARLRAIEPRLALALAKPDATGPDIVPGFWHVRRRNDPPTPDTYMAITGPRGEFREPDEGVLSELRLKDGWNRAARLEREKQDRLRLEREEKDREAEREGRVQDLATAIKSKLSPGTVVNSDVLWTPKAGARRG